MKGVQRGGGAAAARGDAAGLGGGRRGGRAFVNLVLVKAAGRLALTPSARRGRRPGCGCGRAPRRGRATARRPALLLRAPIASRVAARTGRYIGLERTLFSPDRYGQPMGLQSPNMPTILFSSSRGRESIDAGGASAVVSLSSSRRQVAIILFQVISAIFVQSRSSVASRATRSTLSACAYGKGDAICALYIVLENPFWI